MMKNNNIKYQESMGLFPVGNSSRLQLAINGSNSVYYCYHRWDVPYVGWSNDGICNKNNKRCVEDIIVPLAAGLPFTPIELTIASMRS